MAYKKKTLPKDFKELLKTGDLDALRAVFDTCDINAKGGVFKQTALAFSECTDEFTRWLVDQGADLSIGDNYGETPLHARSGSSLGRLDVLIELGADIHHGENARGTPLHKAAGACHVENVQTLLNHGARAAAENKSGLTPLIYALQRCSNIERTAELAALLVQAEADQTPQEKSLFKSLFGGGKRQDAHQTPQAKELVTEIGTNFEFHRGNFDENSVEATIVGLNKLYVLFDVPPVPQRAMHDGKASIVAKAKSPAQQHKELWEFLVPSSGAADTIQGEVVRISGKVNREIDGNGGVNWDKEFKSMANAFLDYVGAGEPLPDAELNEARQIIANLTAQGGNTVRLCELAVMWVGLNPKPEKLVATNYSR